MVHAMGMCDNVLRMYGLQICMYLSCTVSPIYIVMAKTSHFVNSMYVCILSHTVLALTECVQL